MSSSGATEATPNRGNPPQFDVYWNVPSFMCHKYGMKFEELKNFGIRQNAMDEFRGGEIAILYDPGMFPALLTDEKGKTTVLFHCHKMALKRQPRGVIIIRMF